MTVNAVYGSGLLEMRLSGELDHHAARGAVRDIERAIDSHLPSACVLSLGGLTFMDSSGIAVIIKTHRRATEIGATLRVADVGAQPRKVLSAAGLERIVEIEPLANEITA